MALPATIKENLLTLRPQSKVSRVTNILMKIGLYEAVMHSIGNGTDALVELWDDLVDGGVDPRDLEKNDDVSRQIIVTAAAKKGVNIDFSLAKLKKGIDSLARGYKIVRDDFEAQKSAIEAKLETKVDEAQPEVATQTEKDDYERFAHFQKIIKACDQLGFTGANRVNDLYAVAYAINTVTRNDVEDIAKYERFFGSISL